MTQLVCRRSVCFPVCFVPQGCQKCECRSFLVHLSLNRSCGFDRGFYPCLWVSALDCCWSRRTAASACRSCATVLWVTVSTEPADLRSEGRRPERGPPPSNSSWIPGRRDPWDAAVCSQTLSGVQEFRSSGVQEFRSSGVSSISPLQSPFSPVSGGEGGRRPDEGDRWICSAAKP